MQSALRWSLPRVSDDACSADCGQSPNPKRTVARPATGHVKEEQSFYGLACALAKAFCAASSSLRTPRSFVDSRVFAASDFASFGLSLDFHENAIHAGGHRGPRQ